MIQAKNILIIIVFVVYFGACTQKNSENDILNVDKSFSFPKGIPADPGEAGKKTLEGIDSDSDGVRDDVQRWIYARFPDDESKRKALRQMAKSLQIEASQDFKREDARKIMQSHQRDIDCLLKSFDPGGPWYVETEALEAKVFNTKKRSEQYLKNDKIFDGKTLGQTNQDPESFCDK